MPGVDGAVAEFSPAIRFVSLNISYSSAKDRPNLSSSSTSFIHKSGSMSMKHKQTKVAVLLGQVGGKDRGRWSSG